MFPIEPRRKLFKTEIELFQVSFKNSNLNFNWNIRSHLYSKQWTILPVYHITVKKYSWLFKNTCIREDLRKCSNHEAQASRGFQKKERGGTNNDKINVTYKPSDAQTMKICNRGNRLRTASRNTTGGVVGGWGVEGGGLNQLDSPETSPLILLQLQITNMWSVCIGVIYCTVKQSNFNGSNIFGTVETCSRHTSSSHRGLIMVQGQEVYGDNFGKIFWIFYKMLVCLCVLIRIAWTRRF